MKIVDKTLKRKWAESYEAAKVRPHSLAWCYHCDIGFSVYPDDVFKTKHSYRAKAHCPICNGHCRVLPYTMRYRIRHAVASASELSMIIATVLAVTTFMALTSIEVALLQNRLWLGLTFALIPIILVIVGYRFWEPQEWPKDENGNFDRKRVQEALKVEEDYQR